MLRGVYTAMITPFASGRVDEGRLREQVAYQIEQGVDGLVPCGTTGESPTLSHDEHRRVVELTIEAARSQSRPVQVIAGTGSNSTAEAMELTRHAKDSGADLALMVNPYYNKPTQEGMYRHFSRIADEVGLPIVLYNIPGRTGIALTAETIARLARHDNIVGVKEATGSIDVSSEIATLCGPEFDIVSGDDSLTLPIISVSGKGVISVLSNLVPDRIKAMVDAALGNDLAAARERHLALFPLFRAMFLETNPIPIKTAMAAAKRDTGEMRLPLCEMAEDNSAELERRLREAGIG